MSRLVATLRGALIAFSLFVLSVQTVGAQTAVTAPQRTIDKEEGCPALKPYAELDKFGKFYFPESVYEDARTQTEYECRHIWYLSDEIPVSGYIFKPKTTTGRMWPVILYNRGGTGNFGLIEDFVRVEFYLLAKEGYVVLATEYRSIGDKGRRDAIQTIREANHEVLRLRDVLPVESSDMVVITKAQEIDAILLS
jgi:dipeptidyl aminopeptidase/acylaminoacyl peptidase